MLSNIITFKFHFDIASVRPIKILFCLPLLLLLPRFSFGQGLSNIRTRILSQKALADTIKLDTLSIVPRSFTIKFHNGKQADTNLYHIDYAKSTLYLRPKQLLKKYPDALPITVNYRVFPYLFSASAQHKDINNIKPDLYGNLNPYVYNVGKQEKLSDPFNVGSLNKSGSISRGITFGNNQDVSVNSNLNLRLSGKLNNNINILLAATDNNIPIQPDGNTQQLQDFDKVFIQFSTKNARLIAGDFELKRPDSYFMNYYKKAQGLSFSSVYKLRPNIKDSAKAGVMHTTLSAAISKGKYARDRITPIDGNQGPYHLSGAENEPYIIVLSGTEKVYIDGQLMRRGEDNDYTIDYNTAEITFTPKHLINKDMRIEVEFQYSDKNYVRSLIHFGDSYTQNKMRVRLNVYSEQDSKNQPLQQNLSNDQKQLLSSIGDSIQEAFSSSADSVPFSTNEVLYAKRDTVVNSILYSGIYVYSVNSDSAHYRISFSNVGQGNGDYIQINSSANGKVFQWVAPVNNVRQGNYAPVILLITPKKKQMVTVGADYNISRRTKLSVETALSNYDVNTFSTKDKGNDVGYASRVIFKNQLPLSHADSAGHYGWTLNSNFNYELVQKNFTPIERYRSVEFNRDWNRPNDVIVDDQNILGTDLVLASPQTGQLGYHFNAFLEGGNYNATKHGISGHLASHGFALKFDGSLMQSKSKVNTTNFLRHNADLSKKIGWLVAGIKESSEQDLFKSRPSDSLEASSFKNFEWQAYLKNRDDAKNHYGLSYDQRTDYKVDTSAMVKSSYAQNIGLNMELAKNSNSRFRGNITYRILSVLDTTVTAKKPENSVVGRGEYDLRLLHGAIISNTFYQTGSGLEAKQEYSYVQVAAGQGVYSWTDYNGDGVKELNEFQVAAFQDEADYIRVYTPTNDYIKTYTNQFSQQLNIQPGAVWGGKKGVKKFVSHFSNQTAYRTNRKLTTNDPLLIYDPLQQNINDSVLVSLNSSIRNTLYFNQFGAVFGADATYSDNSNKSLLTNGFESRSKQYEELHARWNIDKKWNLSSSYQTGTQTSNSQYFKTNDFNIAYYDANPQISFQPGTSFRTTLLYKYTYKHNKNELGGETAIEENYGVNLKYSALTKGILTVKFNFINIAYNASNNTSLAFEMLDGLKTGKNMTWGFAFERNLSHNMQLSLTYNGRKSEGSKVIHTGGAQVRAFF